MPPTKSSKACKRHVGWLGALAADARAPLVDLVVEWCENVFTSVNDCANQYTPFPTRLPVHSARRTCRLAVTIQNMSAL